MDSSNYFEYLQQSQYSQPYVFISKNDFKRPKSEQSMTYASISRKREQMFDTKGQLKLIYDDPVNQLQHESEYLVKSLNIPPPVNFRGKCDLPKQKFMPKQFYDSHQQEFEDIKQLQNYEAMIESMLDQRQMKKFQKFEKQRAKDLHVQKSIKNSQQMRQQDLHYSPIRTFSKIGARPLFELPVKEQRQAVMNKTTVRRMDQFARAIESSEERRRKRSGSQNDGVRL